MTARPVILHLSVDVNTPQRPRTTTAIEWFIEALDDRFDNVVVAFHRGLRAGPPEECAADGHRLIHLPISGLKYGLDLHASMKRAARRTIAWLEAEGIRPDLVHAHKLTFEGLAGEVIARHFDIPLFVSLRGEVETKVFRNKPGLRGVLRRVSQHAARLYFVSAWFRDEFHRHVPPQPAKEQVLPNIVRNIGARIAPVPANDRFVAIFKLDTWRRKGLPELLDAIVAARRTEPGIRLDIIGDGSADAHARVIRLIAARKLDDVVTVVGALPNAELLARLPHYRAMLLPSTNETFGMVYLEALFAGVPILFTRGTAIDGYLDGLDVARAVRPGNVADITAAMLDLWRSPDTFRQAIADAAPALFNTFDPAINLARYTAEVHAAIAGPPDPPGRRHGRPAVSRAYTRR